MIFKRFLSAFCALAICAGMADAKPVDYSEFSSQDISIAKLGMMKK